MPTLTLNPPQSLNRVAEFSDFYIDASADFEYIHRLYADVTMVHAIYTVYKTMSYEYSTVLRKIPRTLGLVGVNL